MQKQKEGQTERRRETQRDAERRRETERDGQDAEIDTLAKRKSKPRTEGTKPPYPNAAYPD